MKKLFAATLVIFSLLSGLHAQGAKKSALEIKDVNGKVYTIKGTPEGLKISGTEGKVVFLEFFGHNCPPCLMTIPHLIDIQKKHKDKLAVIAVEVQGFNNEQLKAFAKQKGINYTVISGNQERLFVSYISQRAQWQGSIPFMLALDTKGDVQYIQAGMLPPEALEELYKQLSSKPSTVQKK